LRCGLLAGAEVTRSRLLSVAGPTADNGVVFSTTSLLSRLLYLHSRKTRR